MLRNFLKSFLLFLFIIIITTKVLALETKNASLSSPTSHQKSRIQKSRINPLKETPVERRAEKEDKIPPNQFSIAFYKPTYILPYYYTGSPDKRVYANSTPNNEQVTRSEFKYQLSLKVPIWKNIYNHSHDLYLAYTQLSYWQVYNKTAFFRETDYEPELFLSNEVNLAIKNNFKLNFVNVGMVHQSNGFGDAMERSWNRVYIEFISSMDNWMLSLKPWYVIQGKTMRKFNPDIADYLGYGQATFAYKYGKQIFSVQAHNFIEGGGKRLTAEVTWSFPITGYISGYVQGFSGYGQSLIEYNHRTNSIGAGISLSNWI
jgi:phospholipase A1/A2